MTSPFLFNPEFTAPLAHTEGSANPAYGPLLSASVVFLGFRAKHTVLQYCFRSSGFI